MPRFCQSWRACGHEFKLYFHILPIYNYLSITYLYNHHFQFSVKMGDMWESLKREMGEIEKMEKSRFFWVKNRWLLKILAMTPFLGLTGFSYKIWPYKHFLASELHIILKVRNFEIGGHQFGGPSIIVFKIFKKKFFSLKFIILLKFIIYFYAKIMFTTNNYFTPK